MKTITMTLNQRELVLVRVACLQRLDRLKRQLDSLCMVNPADVARLEGLQKSYAETKAMMDDGGVLLRAAREFDNSDIAP